MNDSSTCERDLCHSLEFWMTNFPEKLKDIPLIQLAIPGSHDSCTSSINSSSQISPDAEAPIHKLQFFGFLLRLMLVRWSRTQSLSVTQQLMAGIRYFDLRIATKEDSEELYLVHGQYSDRVKIVLYEIEIFLSSHPKEVVILDCQHFYDFNTTDHNYLMEVFKEIFGKRLLPYSSEMDGINLNYMTEKNSYQVIVVYRCTEALIGQKLFWNSTSFPTPWPETVKSTELVEKLNTDLSRRSFAVGFVSQFVLTPTARFVLRHIYSTLKRSCVKPLNKIKFEWLSLQTPGTGGLNIVISDFVELESYMFCKNVIDLNKKLLTNENVSTRENHLSVVRETFNFKNKSLL